MADAFDLVNSAFEGGLKARLTDLRGQGMSIEAITRQFADDGYPVSRETIRRWLKRVDLPAKVAS